MINEVVKKQIDPEEFNKHFEQMLNIQIKKYLKSRNEDYQGRFKRTPLDTLNDNNQLNSQFMIAEYEKIKKKESKLPSGQRNAILFMIGGIFYQLKHTGEY